MNATDSLTVDLRFFRDAVQDLVRKHKLMRDLMVKEKYSQEVINREEDRLEVEIRNLRINQTTAFQDCLSIIIRQNKG